MRSTRGKTRAIRAQRTQHYTEKAHLSVPVRSNSPEDSRKGNSEPLNTNTPLAKGGISSYYTAREGWGQ